MSGCDAGLWCLDVMSGCGVRLSGVEAPPTPGFQPRAKNETGPLPKPVMIAPGILPVRIINSDICPQRNEIQQRIYACQLPSDIPWDMGFQPVAQG